MDKPQKPDRAMGSPAAAIVGRCRRHHAAAVGCQRWCCVRLQRAAAGRHRYPCDQQPRGAGDYWPRPARQPSRASNRRRLGYCRRGGLCGAGQAAARAAGRRGDRRDRNRPHGMAVGVLAAYGTVLAAAVGVVFAYGGIVESLQPYWEVALVALVAVTFAALWTWADLSHRGQTTRQYNKVVDRLENEPATIREGTRAVVSVATSLNTTSYQKILDAALDIGRLGLRRASNVRVVGMVLLVRDSDEQSRSSTTVGWRITSWISCSRRAQASSAARWPRASP
ncbi:MAG: hypothetical protein HND48_26595 [Chloroflexi bacterium]|nr:hypothetical protein [Chloroflexota bacterium]